eukprot:s3021_g7.t1
MSIINHYQSIHIHTPWLPCGCLVSISSSAALDLAVVMVSMLTFHVECRDTRPGQPVQGPRNFPHQGPRAKTFCSDLPEKEMDWLSVQQVNLVKERLQAKAMEIGVLPRIFASIVAQSSNLMAADDGGEWPLCRGFLQRCQEVCRHNL